MLKLKHENVIDFKKWSNVLYFGTLICVGFICIGELIIAAYASSIAQKDYVLDIWLKILILPTIKYSAVLLFMFLCSKIFLKYKQFALNAFAAVTAISLICFIVVSEHDDVPAALALFVLPILSALLFVDIKPILFALGLNLCLYFLSIFVISPKTQTFYGIVINIIFILACFAMSLMILRSLSTLVNSINHQTKQLKMDSFTKLLNHTSFYDHLTELIADENCPDFTLVFWDIDDFKSVNDVYGHDMGDKVLLKFAEILNGSIAGNEFAFRYGGEEFAAILMRSEESAKEITDKIRDNFKQSSQKILPINKAVTVCAGICNYKKELFANGQELFNAADQALYTAKNTKGKDTSIIWQAHQPKLPARRRSDTLQKSKSATKIT